MEEPNPYHIFDCYGTFDFEEAKRIERFTMNPLVEEIERFANYWGMQEEELP